LKLFNNKKTGFKTILSQHSIFTLKILRVPKLSGKPKISTKELPTGNLFSENLLRPNRPQQPLHEHSKELATFNHHSPTIVATQHGRPTKGHLECRKGEYREMPIAHGV
jgi:hypothetical protein